MSDDVQSEKPRDDSIDIRRRWFVKGLISSVTGLALASGATSSAFAKKRRKGGGGGGGGGSHGGAKTARTPSKRRRHG
jgi:hypothetical protein